MLTDEEYRAPPGKPLTLAAYEAEMGVRAFVEPVAVGDALMEMPLFPQSRRARSRRARTDLSIRLEGRPASLAIGYREMTRAVAEGRARSSEETFSRPIRPGPLR